MTKKEFDLIKEVINECIKGNMYDELKSLEDEKEVDRC